MKVIVIGSGLIGITLAYYLRVRGHDVTVLDRQGGSARETSFANGALLTPSMSDPWNAPGSWRSLLSSLVGAHSGLMVRPRALPGLARWGVSFLRNSSASRFTRSVESNLRLALHSLAAMEDLRGGTGVEYGRHACGTLRIFRNEAALERALAVATSRSELGLRFRHLSRDEVSKVEPGLAPITHQLVGAIHYLTDETGDAYTFCVALEQHLIARGVSFHFQTNVRSIEVRGSRVAAVVTDRDRLVADEYVVAAGSYSAALLKSLGIPLQVQPAKGYSVTFDLPGGLQVLGTPVVDDELHAAVIPLSGAVRVAGTAEFAGYDRELMPARINALLNLISQILPNAPLERSIAQPWCGLRPMSADGVPLIGSTSFANLRISTGHGHLGWTLAAGSAQLLAAMMCGEDPGIDPTPYDPRRFSVWSARHADS